MSFVSGVSVWCLCQYAHKEKQNSKLILTFHNLYTQLVLIYSSQICQALSLYLSLLPPPLPLSLSLSHTYTNTHFLSLSVSLSLSDSLSLSLSVSLCLSLSLSLSHSLLRKECWNTDLRWLQPWVCPLLQGQETSAPLQLLANIQTQE